MIFTCKHSVNIISTQIGCQVGKRGEFEGYEVFIFKKVQNQVLDENKQ